MINYFKYAFSRFFVWLGYFAVVVSIISLLPIEFKLAIIFVLLSLLLSFIIPLVISIKKKEFNIKVIGSSKVSIKFGDIFDEDCFLITTNRYFDVDVNGELVSESSLLGLFIKKYYESKTEDLKGLIDQKLVSKGIKCPTQYGTTILINNNKKWIYLMAFTDRKKTAQTKDFYIKSIKGFLKEIINANHGKVIALPLLGDNNNLSNSGFLDSGMALDSLIALINEFGIENPTCELKLRIVILPKKRASVISSVMRYAK